MSENPKFPGGCLMNALRPPPELGVPQMISWFVRLFMQL